LGRPFDESQWIKSGSQSFSTTSDHRYAIRSLVTVVFLAGTAGGDAGDGEGAGPATTEDEQPRPVAGPAEERTL